MLSGKFSKGGTRNFLDFPMSQSGPAYNEQFYHFAEVWLSNNDNWENIILHKWINSLRLGFVNGCTYTQARVFFIDPQNKTKKRTIENSKMRIKFRIKSHKTRLPNLFGLKIVFYTSRQTTSIDIS